MSPILKPLIYGSLIAASCFAATSCKSVKYTASNQNTELLPALRPEMDVRSFETAYSLGSSSSSAVSMASGGNTAFTVGRSVHHADPRIQWAIRRFEDEVMGKFSFRTGQTYGYAVCRINTHLVRRRGKGWTTLSIFTLGAANLFGVPNKSYQGYSNIEIQILDANKNVIEIYQATASTKKLVVALYHGYSADAAKSKALSDAFTMAVNQIKEQISADFDRVKATLEKNGPIKG